MLFGEGLNKTYQQLIDYDSYQGQTSFRDEFKAKLTDLKESAQALSDPEGEVYAARDAEFESDAIEVTVKDNADVSNYEIEVEQVAAKQLNETEAVVANVASELAATLNHIEIEAGSKAIDLHIEREPNQSNEELFETIAEAINSEEIDITARVVTNESGEISLAIQAHEAGEENVFTIEGNLADALNLGEADQIAQDAVLRVDHEIITSNSNLVKLDNGRVGIQINAETTIPFDLQIEVSGHGALSAAKNFSNSFNQAMVFLQGLRNVQSKLLSRQFEKAIDDNSEKFEELGIRLNQNKKIVIDEDKFSARFEENESEAKKILTEFRSSVNKVERRSTEALRIPASTFSPSPPLPENVKPINLSYDQNLRPIPVNALFTRGSIIDVFF